ncbi:MAG: hypothetical protein ACREBT_06520 [Thermoplasmata archaeon]
MVRLVTELTARVVVITAIFAVISGVIITRAPGTLPMSIAVPLLFVLIGVVLLISVLYCLTRYHVADAVR